MSMYYEALGGGDFERVKKDIISGGVNGVKAHKVARENLGFESEESLCVTDGENFVYLREGDFQGGLGLKVWGRNEGDNIIQILEEKYGYKFVYEEDLGIMHI